VTAAGCESSPEFISTQAANHQTVLRTRDAKDGSVFIIIQEQGLRIMKRISDIERKTKETDVHLKLNIDGSGKCHVSTGIAFFDHMLTLFAVHGFFDLNLTARGDLEVDHHHTVEDVGLVLGDAFNQALGNKKGIQRYGHAATPMDDALSTVTVDLSNRPFLVYNIPRPPVTGKHFDIVLAKEFFRAFATHGGMNLHINVAYGENEHHLVESIFKSTGRALDQATRMDARIVGVRSSKGTL
jgi:imidazoleglycerol-phosphate dehydratase